MWAFKPFILCLLLLSVISELNMILFCVDYYYYYCYHKRVYSIFLITKSCSTDDARGKSGSTCYPHVSIAHPQQHKQMLEDMACYFLVLQARGRLGFWAIAEIVQEPVKLHPPRVSTTNGCTVGDSQIPVVLEMDSQFAVLSCCNSMTRVGVKRWLRQLEQPRLAWRSNWQEDVSWSAVRSRNRG